MNKIQGPNHHWIKGKEDRWKSDGDDFFMTFTDALLLLLAFFVVMFSISVPSQEKYEQIKSAIVSEFSHRKVEMPFTETADQLINILKKLLARGEVSIFRTPTGITMEFASSSFYDSGSAKIRGSMKPVLNDIANALKQIGYKDYEVEVEGHTDDIPINTPQYPSNWELSVARATNVIRYIINAGIKSDRLKAAGYADTRPKSPNRDKNNKPIPGNQAENRRIVIRIQR